MKNLFKTKIGRLRIIGFLESISLIVLVFIALPIKYYFGNPKPTAFFGLIHGVLLFMFIINTLSVGVEQNWKFKRVTYKMILISFIPFGVFFIDKFFLREIYKES